MVWSGCNARVARASPGEGNGLVPLCLFGYVLDGVGRLLSVLSLGSGSNSLVPLTLELVVPPLLLFWQNKVASLR